MKVVTPTQMQEIDRQAIKNQGIPSIVLMENAGRKVSEVAMEMVPKGLKVCIFCGSGNNGGDGLVVSRHLANNGYNVRVVIFGSRRKGDAKTNLDIVKNMGISCVFIKEKEALENEKKNIISYDLIIDALLGTGLKGEVRGFLKDIVSFLNHIEKPILSVDCPSGLGEGIEPTLDNCVKASITVTLGLPKTPLVTYPGARFVGKLYIADIGIPKHLLEQEKWNFSLIDRELILPYLLQKREPDAHKGDFGHVLLISGSRNTPGASVLATLGTLKSGAGLVTVAIPKSIHSIIAGKLTEAMTLPLPETLDGLLSCEGEKEILEFAHTKADVIVIGPGISLNKETGKVVRNIISNIKRPLIIDADGITHLVDNLEILAERKYPTIITPHPGEMGRLIGFTPKEVNNKRIEVAANFSLKYGVYTVLKGASTVVSSPEGGVFINTSGNPGMSTGGMGDVLTGLIAGYMAQKFSPLQSAILGVYLHGVSGDYLKEKMGERGILAGDLARIIPFVSKKVLNGELTDKFQLV